VNNNERKKRQEQNKNSANGEWRMSFNTSTHPNLECGTWKVQILKMKFNSGVACGINTSSASLKTPEEKKEF